MALVRNWAQARFANPTRFCPTSNTCTSLSQIWKSLVKDPATLTVYVFCRNTSPIIQNSENMLAQVMSNKTDCIAARTTADVHPDDPANTVPLIVDSAKVERIGRNRE